MVGCWPAAPLGMAASRFYPVLRAAKGSDTLQGTWVPSAAELGGKALPDEARKAIKLVVQGARYTVRVGSPAPRARTRARRSRPSTSAAAIRCGSVTTSAVRAVPPSSRPRRAPPAAPRHLQAGKTLTRRERRVQTAETVRAAGHIRCWAILSAMNCRKQSGAR
jgi:uncharacterized protein (TIGR03067 family)